MADFIESAIEGDRVTGLNEYQRLLRYAQEPDTRVYEFLPTYDAATTRRPWNLIAPYVKNTDDILSACLVSKKLNRAFTPHLWGSPAKHFGKNTSRHYRILRHFFRCVEIADIRTRVHVHTLDLIKIDNFHRSLDFHDYWLPTLFQLLPSLQVVQVNHLRPLMMRTVLSALWNASRSLLDLAGFQHNYRFGLRMLALRDLKNVEPKALASALKMFPNLIYLDLSDTLAAGTMTVIRVIGRERYYPALQILKLRKVRLNNLGFFSIIAGLSPRLWSLDVRNNMLMDNDFLGPMLQHAFVEPREGPPCYRPEPRRGDTRTADARLEMLPLNDRTQFSHTDHRLKNILKVDTEAYVRGVVGRSPAINLGPEVDNGLTHLYISNNKFTLRSIRMLIRKGRLRVFDAGTILPSSGFKYPTQPTENSFETWATPAAQTFWYDFNRVSNGSLYCLRLNHHMITGDAELFDDGVVPPEDKSFQHWPIFEKDVMDLKDGLHIKLSGRLVRQLMGVRVLLLSDIPLRSHRGWIARMLIDFIDVLGKTPNSIEWLYLELTTDAPSTAPKPKNSDDGPTWRKLPGGRRAPVQNENPFVGDVEEILKDYLVSHKKWKGGIKFMYPPQHSWGPSSQYRATKLVGRKGKEKEVLAEAATSVEVSPRQHMAKKKRWFHIPWGGRNRALERQEAAEVEREAQRQRDLLRDQYLELLDWGSSGFRVFEDETAGS